MLPEGAHNREQDWTIMFLNRTKRVIDDVSEQDTVGCPENSTQAAWTGDRAELTTEEEAENRFLYGLNLVRTKHDKTVRRGAVVKALAVFSRYHFIDVRRGATFAAIYITTRTRRSFEHH
jgi:hypothetical protein